MPLFAERPIFALEDRLGRVWAGFRECEESTTNAREELEQEIGPQSTGDASIVFHGSLARREFTEGSDADWSLLIDGKADTQHMEAALEIKDRIVNLGIGKPGPEGIFGRLAFSHDLVNYIGGSDDSNSNTTRRILLLLESIPIGIPDAHRRVVRNVLARYLSEDYGWRLGRPVPRFLLNDIARYWRTIAVDFAYKQRQRGGQGWALRSAKLRLSRKLIYASGLLYCFSSARHPEIASLTQASDSRTQAVTEHLWGLSQQPPIDLLASTLMPYPALHGAALDIFDSYDEFLRLMRDPKIRRHLDELGHDDADGDGVFNHVREIGHLFQVGLDRVFLEANESGILELVKRFGVF
jgi:hypothetical protein